MSISENSFTLIPHKNGVRLVEGVSGQNISTLKDFSENRFNIYLLDNESRAKKFNQHTLETCGFDSFRDISGKTVVDVWGKSESLLRVLAHDREVVETGMMKIAEETVFSSEGIAETALSFKFPWYNDRDQCIGLLGCTLQIDSSVPPIHLSLSEYLAVLVNVGLLKSPSESQNILPGLLITDNYFSRYH